ncbi:MAG: Transcription regulator [Parcubacteria group bacterium GW2011_GWC2_39_14]|nr:MAG: Transcription regulator [Parcubacteria group bacterium GW2011_GWC2_39_14]KKR55504.1 MAG: Transcription regulator [Parcubacteria group bacterium GW2011_GWA2_40_23]
MYYYVYDTFLSDKKYEKVLDKIKVALLDLDIQGKHERLTLLKSIDELIKDEVKRGINTLIVLGNDKTLLRVIDTVGRHNITLGMIPIGPDNKIAECLGIPPEEAACEIIAARKIIQLDLGKANDQYFFSSLKVEKNINRVSIHKDNYRIVPQPNCVEFDIYNFYYPAVAENYEKEMKKFSPQDEKLELVIRKQGKRQGWFKKKDVLKPIDSIIQSKVFKIKSFEYLPVVLDGYKVIKTPVIVELAPCKLKMIVGKDRLKHIQ